MVDHRLNRSVGLVVARRLAVGQVHDEVLLAVVLERRVVASGIAWIARLRHAVGTERDSVARVVHRGLVQRLGQRREPGRSQIPHGILDRCARGRDVLHRVHDPAAAVAGVVVAVERHETDVDAVDRVEQVRRDVLHDLEARLEAGRAIRPVEVVAAVDRIGLVRRRRAPRDLLTGRAPTAAGRRRAGRRSVARIQIGRVDAVAMDATVVLALDDAAALRGADVLPASTAAAGRVVVLGHVVRVVAGRQERLRSAVATQRRRIEPAIRAAIGRGADAGAPVDAGRVAAADGRVRDGAVVPVLRHHERAHAAGVVDHEQDVRSGLRAQAGADEKLGVVGNRGHAGRKRPKGAEAEPAHPCFAENHIQVPQFATRHPWRCVKPLTIARAIRGPRCG